MSTVRIVTDSTALFVNPQLVKQYNITIVPAYVYFGDDCYKLGIDIDSEEFLHRLRYGDMIPRLVAPSEEDFVAVYSRLNQETTEIVSIHISAQISDIVKNAQAASKTLLGRCDIAVIDSLTLSAGLGILVERAGQLAMHRNDLEAVVRDIRQAIPRLYTVFYVESMKSICHHNLISEAQTILGTMLGIMPFITIEEGQLVIMEKALNTSQAVEKLVEFAAEFTDIEQLVILHHSTTLTDSIRQLQDRLALELPRSNFPTRLYDGSIATFLGPDANGLVIFESEDEESL